MPSWTVTVRAASTPSPISIVRIASDAQMKQFTCRYFHRDSQLGTIERGKLADFILIDGDPTKDISALRRNRMTMVGGVAYYPAEIFERLAIKPFAPPPPITRPQP